ncbi:MAG: Fe-S cluster assembly protein SufB, partial [Bdellovibrionales bacterium]|nr:Fe-S cluster assembly protein SufB [Bdellovibrionales bacterium]
MVSSDIKKKITEEYKYGFTTDIEADQLPPGLDERVIRAISAKKDEPDWMTDWRLKAFARWQGMREPSWAHLSYPPIDYQGIIYYSAPKKKLQSLDEVDPKLLETYDKLGIPL